MIYKTLENTQKTEQH